MFQESGIPASIRLLLVCVCLAIPAFADENWNQWLGGAERRNVADLVPRSIARKPVRLHELWRRPFGSGYSAVSVYGDNLVSMMKAGDTDYVVMLDAKTGKERWRFRIGPTYRGHDNTLDGPRSTPALDERFVYAIGPRGTLFCLASANGKLRWKIDLQRKFKASESFQGFATSPLLEGDRLIVQTGGAKGASCWSLVALDRRTGRILWRAEHDPTEYTSPACATIRGVRQVIAQSAERVFAVRIDDGELLWEIPLSEGGFWTPLPIPPDRVFLSAGTRSMMIQVNSRAAGLEPRVLWKTPRMGSVINPVVYHEGTDTIFGANSINSRRLTALDAKTGKLRWIQRRDAMTLLAGEFLCVLSDREGKLLVGKPTQDGYSPSSEYQLYEIEGNVRVDSPMAYSGGTLYVRTPTEIIAMRF